MSPAEGLAVSAGGGAGVDAAAAAATASVSAQTALAPVARPDAGTVADAMGPAPGKAAAMPVSPGGGSAPPGGEAAASAAVGAEAKPPGPPRGPPPPPLRKPGGASAAPAAGSGIPPVLPDPDPNLGPTELAAAAQLDAILDAAAAADTDGFFARPVRVQECPNYYTVVARPMSFAMIKAKVSSHMTRVGGPHWCVRAGVGWQGRRARGAERAACVRVSHHADAKSSCGDARGRRAVHRRPGHSPPPAARRCGRARSLASPRRALELTSLTPPRLGGRGPRGMHAGVWVHASACAGAPLSPFSRRTPTRGACLVLIPLPLSPLSHLSPSPVLRRSAPASTGPGAS
jgi:hypothetical protein